MYYCVKTAAVNGIRAYPVKVEIDICRGLPHFEIVGLPDASVREAKERVRSAIRNAGYEFPNCRITVNLAPADIRKEGSAYDLSIAVGILAASGQISINACWAEWFYLGELTLAADIRGVPGVLPVSQILQSNEPAGAFVPAANYQEEGLFDENKVIAAAALGELVNILSDNIYVRQKRTHTSKNVGQRHADYNEVKGQIKAKRALEIAAAGGHNVILCGPPGSGKSMLLQRFPGILPPLSRSEALEVMQIYSVAGLQLSAGVLPQERPMRAPHHSSTKASLLGGGANPKPGEISLAHNGVLFLDEMAEFSRDVLNALRQPLEEGVVHLSRQRYTVSYPARFILAGALNPCRCGYYGYEQIRACTCSQHELKQYKARISGPILDRIDLQVACQPLDYSDLHSTSTAGDSSQVIRERIIAAREQQQQRCQGQVNRKNDVGWCTNSQLDSMGRQLYCQLNDSCRRLLQQAYSRLGLSVRAHDKIIKVARTIADLDGSRDIQEQHLAEAVQYRCFDWNHS